MEVILVVAAFLIGYFIGRRDPKIAEPEEVSEALEMKTIRKGDVITSPVDGKVHFFSEGGRKGVAIEPMQGAVYAPVAGKITKLYPMGNSFILTGENQTELLIQVGRRQPDELCSMYYVPHIIQNEIVTKGKLLLNFDMERLVAVGEDVAVTVSFEDCGDNGDIGVTRKEQVRVGEELMWIHKKE
uniref:PTS glucose transporter subunit IIA n=1 Tax=Acetatifactor sp. TaxID=1872090 RepID=UPI0040565CD2